MKVLPIVATASALAISACTTFDGETPFDCQAHQAGIPTLMTVRGCSVQLTDRWAVTARHLDWIMPQGVADPDMDLFFFRHDGVPPVWRDPVAGEKVTAHGNPWNVLDLTGLTFAIPMRDERDGYVKGTAMIAPNFKGEVPIVLFSGHPIMGYSGGPLVGQDNAVVGLVWGDVESPATNNQTGLTFDYGDGLATPTKDVFAAFKRDVKEP